MSAAHPKRITDDALILLGVVLMPSPRRSEYARALTRPRVRSTFLFSLIGRFAYALVYLPLFYAAEAASGSLAVAGFAVGLYGAGATLAAPVRAWLIDTCGARPVLTVLVVAFGTVLGALAWAAAAGATAWPLLVLAAVAGAVAPPLGPTMRVAWARLVPDGDLLKHGMSLDAVVEELMYLAGPALAGLAVAVAGSGAALLVPAGLVVVGGLLFVGTPAVTAMMPRPRPRPQPRRVVRVTDRVPLVASRRFVGLLVPALVAGVVGGTIGVAIPAAVNDLGGAAAAGLVLGLFAAGSAVGGLLYGLVRLRMGMRVQLFVLSALLVCASAVVAATTNVMSLGGVLAVAGVFASPVMIVAYLVVPAAAGPHQQNAANTWVNTSYNLGSAAASAGVGFLIQQASLAVVLLAVGVAGLALLGAGGALAATHSHTMAS